MRLVAMCVAGLLLMQLPATASIVSSASQDTDGPNRWNVTYGYLAWDPTHGVLRLSSGDVGADSEPVELLLSSEVFSCMWISGLELPALGEAGVAGSSIYHGLALSASFGNPATTRLEHLSLLAAEEEEAYSRNIHRHATAVCPEPATLTIWGVSALALAAATYRRQKRAGKNRQHVQAAVKEYLEACSRPSEHFRMLGSYLTRLADDPNWTKQDVEAFYDEVVVALHHRREHAEVA